MCTGSQSRGDCDPVHNRWPALILLLLTAGLLAGCNDTDDEPVTTDQGAQPLTLEIRPVKAETSMTMSPSGDELGTILKDPSATTDEALELGPPALTASDVESAQALESQNMAGWQVQIDFTEEGDAKFAKLTGKAACATGAGNRIAIVIDDAIVSAPSVNAPCGSSITDGTSISGDFSEEEAKELAERINDGQ